MKAITVWQPWAGLLAAKVKRFETRAWATPHRGELAIHAGQHTMSAAEEATLNAVIAEHCPNFTWQHHIWKRGRIVCIGRLVSCQVVTPALKAKQTELELSLGDWSLGRYVWEYEVDRIANALEGQVSGKQGLWEWQE